MNVESTGGNVRPTPATRWPEALHNSTLEISVSAAARRVSGTRAEAAFPLPVTAATTAVFVAVALMASFLFGMLA